MELYMPLWKIVKRPLIPIRESWQDAVPLVGLFVLLSLAVWGALRLRGRAQQRFRRGVQVASALLFIIFLHRCLCALRGWVFGLELMGRNNLIAFGHMAIFVAIMAFTIGFGRVFCGWLCPLGAASELLAGVVRLRDGLSRRRSLLAGYLLLGGLTVLIVWMAWMVRPDTQFFSENIAAVWGIFLLVLLVFALPRADDDLRLKRIKYASAIGWIGLSVIGVFVTNPWCVLMGDELDYSSLVSIMAVLAGGAVVTMAWCRYLCPLGAAVGLLALLSPVRVVNDAECTSCGRCEGLCPMNAIDRTEIDQTSCIYCGKCLGVCEYRWETRLIPSEEVAAG
ncbi:MAG: 4Fe-4S binding protein [Armatimonadota bacterium]